MSPFVSFRFAPRLLAALLLSAPLWPAPAHAQAADPGAPVAERSVRLVFRPGASGVETSNLVKALRKELGVEITTDPAAEANGGTLTLDLEASQGYVLGEFTAVDGKKTVRLLARPDDPERSVEVMALLAGNLVRNEASELLEELAKAREAEAARLAAEKPPPPPPAKPQPKAEKPKPVAKPKTKPAGKNKEAPWQPKHPLKDGGFINLSLAHPITLQPESEHLSVVMELGLFYSRIGETRAFALNPFVLRNDERAQGAQLTGIYAYAERLEGAQLSGVVGMGRHIEGVQLSGAVNFGRGPMYGVQGSGAVNVTLGKTEGVQGAGAVNFAKDDLDGVQAAGAANYVGRKLEGVQVAGAVNYAGRAAEGGQAAGLGNVADGVEGFQAGILNLSLGKLDGFQAGIVNSVFGPVEGAQVGLINVGGAAVDGVQVGLVNVAGDVKGTSIGLVSIAKNGRIQPSFWVASGKRINAGVAFEVGPVYSLPFIGADAYGDRNYEWGFNLGLRARYERLFAGLEAGYSSEQKQFDQEITPIERGRLLGGIEVIEHTLSLFGGVGVRTSELKQATVESHFGVAFF
ncbi:MAG: hypothetical protein H6718_03100 [Polyangiaceae bacterium]|nr:hypothetical protein [Myxococcales bacterium]MCB9584355.1 hypothetical protein [Polyangiaceae bacterium]